MIEEEIISRDSKGEDESELQDEPNELEYLVSRIKRKDNLVVSYQGMIESGEFSSPHSMHLLYNIVSGEHWKVMEGQTTGISQHALQDSQQAIWNFPFEVTYESKQPLGWPQMVIVVYGKDMWGRSIVKGYANCVLPVAPGLQVRKVPVFATIPPSTAANCCAWLRGHIHDLREPERVLLGDEGGRECLKTKSIGFVTIKTHVRRYNFEKHGLD